LWRFSRSRRELERVSVPGFSLDFKAFRVLAGIAREGLLEPPSREVSQLPTHASSSIIIMKRKRLRRGNWR